MRLYYFFLKSIKHHGKYKYCTPLCWFSESSARLAGRRIDRVGRIATMAELLIDPNIRVWVFLPIVVITFLVGIIRHYVSMLIASQKKVELTQIQDR